MSDEKGWTGLRGTGEVDLGHGMHLKYVDGSPRFIGTNDLPRLEAVIGRKELASLLRLLNVAERLISLAHLAHMNDVHNLPNGDVPHRRNLHHLFFLIMGALREGVNALDKAVAAGITRVVSKRSAEWLELEAIRKRWSDGSLADTIRNQLAAHFGEAETIERGLSTYAEGTTFALVEYCGDGRQYETSFPAAIDATLRGFQTDEGTFQNEFRAAMKDQAAFIDGVQELINAFLMAHNKTSPSDGS